MRDPRPAGFLRRGENAGLINAANIFTVKVTLPLPQVIMPPSSLDFPRPFALEDYWRFFIAFLRRPLAVGAIAPSSARLARAILRHCDLENAETVVELGPGTGAITRVILERLRPETRLLALELDRQHVDLLRERHPEVTVCRTSAEHLGDLLREHRCAPADCIVSGLPWGNMGSGLQDRIMGEVRATLKPGGHFCGFGYLHAHHYPSTRAFHRRLQAHFSEVRFSRVVWQNLPPALAFSCS